MGSPSRKKAKQDGEHGAGFVDGHHLVDVTQLEGLEVAQPGGSGSQAGQQQKEERCGADVPDLPLGAHDKHHGPRKNQHHKGADGGGHGGVGLPDAALGQNGRHTGEKRGSSREENPHTHSSFLMTAPWTVRPRCRPLAETPCPRMAHPCFTPFRRWCRQPGRSSLRRVAPPPDKSRRPPSGRLRQSTRS